MLINANRCVRSPGAVRPALRVWTPGSVRRDPRFRSSRLLRACFLTSPNLALPILTYLVSVK